MSVLVGRPAPDFTAAAVLPDGRIDTGFTLSEHLSASYGVLLFWPQDFTFVCPSEIFAYDHRLSDLAALGAKLVGISTDSEYVHHAWRRLPVKDGGLGEVGFPMIADTTKAIARAYGVLLEDRGVALRGTFLVDRGGIVRHQLVNDLPLGRNADETVRTLEALRHSEDFGEACPAGWRPGDRGVPTTAEGIAAWLAETESA